MFQTVLHRANAIEIRTKGWSIMINPQLSHKETKEYIFNLDNNVKAILICWKGSQQVFFEDEKYSQELAQHWIEVKELLENTWIIQYGSMNFEYIESIQGNYVMIENDSIKIVYDIAIVEAFELSDSNLDLMLVHCNKENESMMLELVKVNRPKTVVSLTNDQLLAIDFSSKVMMQRVTTPKYLKPGQYIIHN